MISPFRKSIFGVVILITGCSTHPLPEDYSNSDTKKIVNKIFCEAREAVTQITIKALKAEKYKKDGDEKSVIEKNDNNKFPEIGRLIEDLEGSEFKLRNLERIFKGEEEKKFGKNVNKYRDAIGKHPKLLEILNGFKNSTLGLDFEFDISETNNNQIDAQFRFPFTSSLFTIGFVSGAKLKRKNVRKFQTGTSFIGLQANEKLDYDECKGLGIARKKLIHPITGNIGLTEVFDTFIELHKINDGLGIKGAGAKQKATRKFTHTITYTTTLTANVSPKIAVDDSVAEKFRLASVTGTFDNSREDLHQVTVSITKIKNAPKLTKEKLKITKKFIKLKRLNELMTKWDDDERKKLKKELGAIGKKLKKKDLTKKERKELEKERKLKEKMLKMMIPAVDSLTKLVVLEKLLTQETYDEWNNFEKSRKAKEPVEKIKAEILERKKLEEDKKNLKPADEAKLKSLIEKSLEYKLKSAKEIMNKKLKILENKTRDVQLRQALEGNFKNLRESRFDQTLQRVLDNEDRLDEGGL